MARVSRVNAPVCVGFDPTCWVNGTYLVLPAHLEKPHRLIEPLQGYVATAGEQEVLARHQLPHDVRGQYLARLTDLTACSLDPVREEELVP